MTSLAERARLRRFHAETRSQIETLRAERSQLDRIARDDERTLDDVYGYPRQAWDTLLGVLDLAIERYEKVREIGGDAEVRLAVGRDAPQALSAYLRADGPHDLNAFLDDIQRIVERVAPIVGRTQDG